MERHAMRKKHDLELSRNHADIDAQVPFFELGIKLETEAMGVWFGREAVQSLTEE
jgi:hypothetical protein